MLNALPYSTLTNNTGNSILSPSFLALMSKASYCRDRSNNKFECTQDSIDYWLKQESTTQNSWQVISEDDGMDGFQGFAAGRDYDGDGKYDEIIFAFTGTNSFLDIATSDVQIAINRVPGQVNKAEKFYESVMYTKEEGSSKEVVMTLADNIDPNATITFTGHSLGGTIAQVMAANHNKSAVTFNAPGVSMPTGSNTSGIINYVNMNDPIGCYHANADTTLYYMPDGIVNSEFKPHSDYFEQDFSKYITLPSSVQWEHHHAASLQIYDTKHKGLFTSTTLELWASKKYLEEAGETQEKASEDIIKTATEQALFILSQMNESRESFRKIGLTFEEKAFYDILIALRNEHNFDYGTDKEVDGVVINDKCKSLAQKVKEIIDTKSSFADWLNNRNVRNQLKLDIKICLVKNGYPPQYSPEVFNKVMKQVENFQEHQE